MTRGFIVTGTDTNIGKTVFCAGLTGLLQGLYWKPVQAGLGDDGNSDSAIVSALCGLPARHILPEAYRLSAPLSPHEAAARERLTITPEALVLPQTRPENMPDDAPLIIEGAGGALVPLTNDLLYADIFVRWQLPVIIVASTKLGTINHSLLTIEALRTRRCPLHGIAFIGPENPASEAAIAHIGNIRPLGRLPHLPVLNQAALQKAFAVHFSRSDFL